MLEGIPVSLLDGVGVVAVVLLLGLMIATGGLHTRGQVRRLEEAHARELQRLETQQQREVDDTNHDRDEWRAESRIKDQHIIELTEQNTALLETVGPTLTNFLEGMRQVAEQRRGGDPT